MKQSGLAGLMLTASILATLLVAPAASAAPSWSKIAVSRNGSTWTTDIAQPLISKLLRPAPGGQRTRTFYVRNQSGETAYLEVGTRVRARGRGERPSLFHLSLFVEGAWHRLTEGRHQVTRLLTRSGEVVPVRIRVRMGRHASYRWMDHELRLKVHLRLTDRNVTRR